MASRRSVTTAVIVLVLAAAGVGYWWQQPADRPSQQQRFSRAGNDGPVPVVAALARRSDVPVYLDGVGNIKALNTVTVRSQVDGKLISVNYVEGQDVQSGFVVAKVDPTTYQAAYDQAVAKKALDEATLANARLDLERYTKLVASNSVPRQQLDTQKMTVAQQEAQVNLDQAAIDSAKATLDYTNIVAPLSGRTGIRLVDQGNIVHASDTTGIVVITQLQPISILFTLPQQQLGVVNKALSAGTARVDAFGPDNKTVIESGQLKVVDNQVDTSTGTIKLKAEFPNNGFQLWPGAFVNVRLLIDTLKQVVVAPTAAVQRGPNGAFVYVVQPDNKVAVRPVTLAQQDEVQAVISKGIDPDQRVVTTGFARLTDGAEVSVTNAESAPSPDAPSEPRRRGNGGNRRDRNANAPRSEATRSSAQQ